MNKIATKISAFLASKTFTRIIFGFFIFEALWFVCSAIYPMAFDEDFHFGLIKLYSHHWLPFLSSQPADANQYGAVVRDPSFLYHYLMSFPYRLVQVFTNNETAQIIVLRLMNVAMFVYALELYRRVMLRAKASVSLINVTLALFVLVPIVPQLAAHINYDNFFMVLVALLCLASFDLVEGLKKRKVNSLALLSFVLLSMTATLVKYAGLPIILAAVVFLAGYAYLQFKGRMAALWPAIAKGFAISKRPMLFALVGLTVVMAVFFVQRYGVNLVQYKNPVPDCGDVLTDRQCNEYGPWARDHNYTLGKPADFHPNFVWFLYTWLSGMWHRLFFSINGNVADGRYANTQGSPLPSWSFAALAIVGVILMFVWLRKICSGNTLLTFGLAVSLFYILVLFVNSYSDYGRVGHAVAINGRYLLPIMPLMALPVARAVALLLAKLHQTQLKPWLAAVCIVLALNGGGVFGFMSRSDPRWYWPNPTVQKINKAAHNLVDPLVIK